ncbi:MAG: gliding motility protein GldC [Candidatus Hydrogenedentota bacterium]|nr:MAG: gliding motility protein GldC [Candidatus Hydrogenedentota bacterium]
MPTEEINIKVELDDKNVPEKIYWYATSSDMDNYKEARAMSLSFWDPNENNSLILSLWTKEMLVGDMNTHLFETLMTLADNYERATGFHKIAEKLRSHAKDLASEMAKLNRESP